MKSVTTERFRKCYEVLPDHVKQSSIKAFEIWQKNPRHTSLKFKKIHSSNPIYSVRISLAWRALGVKQGNVMTWFWIGSHSEYDKLIKDMR